MKIKNSVLRIFFLTVILILSTVTGYLHQLSKRFPPIDAFCPFGGLESAMHFFKYGMLIKRIAFSSLILLAVTIAAALIMRRSFCGYICPLGTLQELVSKAGKLLKIKKITLNPKADRYTRLLKYPVLILFIYLSWITGTLAVRPYDPWAAYHHIYSTEVFSKFMAGFIILVLSVFSAPFIERFFCKYLCPMGGFLGLLSRISFFRIKRDQSSCTACGECSSVCQMNIDVMNIEQVKSSECISCGECIDSCPVEGALKINAPGIKKTFSVKPVLILIITLFLFVSVIGISTMTGDFKWKRNFGMPAKMARLIDGPEKIREDNTLQEICIIYRIHPYFFAENFKLAKEEDFYKTLEELNIDSVKIREIIRNMQTDAHVEDSCSSDG